MEWLKLLSPRMRGDIIRSLLDREFGGLSEEEALAKAIRILRGKKAENRSSPIREETGSEGGGEINSFTI